MSGEHYAHVPMPVIAVIGSSRTESDHPDYHAARRLGRLLAKAGYTVASGGYGGLMEAVSDGARSAGGPVVGFTAPAVFPGRDGVNEFVTDERPADSLTERIHRLLDEADAVVALPGSIGTLTELMSAWNLAFVAPFSGKQPKPIVAVGSPWADIVPYLTEHLDTNGALVTIVRTVEEAVSVIADSAKSAGDGGATGMLSGGSGALP